MTDKHPFLDRVVIPAAAAIITGLFLAAAVLAYCLLAGKPAALALAAGAVGAFITWLLRPSPSWPVPLNLAMRTHQVEVKVKIISEGGAAGDYLNLPIDQDRLRTFAKGLAAGRALTSREWTGRGALFSGSEFARLRSELIGRGLARWVSERDPRGGCVLTAKGRATMQGLGQPPPCGPVVLDKF